MLNDVFYGGVAMAIFYMDVNIIGRSSWRSSIGAAAYRAGEKLHSIGHAAYQSGEKLQSKSGKITHDYRKKKGVIHSEIMLPDNAPPEYADRETLWNSVEKSEKRKDAQLAREIIVALPQEYDLFEQLEIIRQYSQENFVNIGICADIALHDTGEGNPHAHIMLTTRNISKSGFGQKNREWNNKEKLMRWRENWATVNNRMLERKGLDERIDHRTLKEQGLDREPTIHLGHKAAALAKKGIRTQRGDYNRKITRRNEIRVISEEMIDLQQRQELMQIRLNMMQMQQQQMEMQQQQHEIMQKLERIIETTQSGEEIAPNELVTKLKTANRVSELPKSSAMSDSQPTTPQTQYDEPGVVKRAKRSAKVRGIHIALDRELRVLRAERVEDEKEIRRLDVRIEKNDEDAKNIRTLNDRLVQLQAEHQILRVLELKRKREIDKEIKLVEGDIRAAEYYFRENYGVTPNEASVDIERTRKQKEIVKAVLDERNKRIESLAGKLRIIENVRRDHGFRIKRVPKQRDGEKTVQTGGIERRRSASIIAG